ncbi:hypothetical protein U9M48_008123 [Paspalum notatum var. saurae]|uniref:Uncharacterized protein n=1 Tax=Paspalum notatum var. saurae TaxID=547442 RepID=A0AAQ3SNG9_PASNO
MATCDPNGDEHMALVAYANHFDETCGNTSPPSGRGLDWTLDLAVAGGDRVISEGSNHKQPSSNSNRSRATSAPRVSRLAKPASKPAADRAPSKSPLHHAAAGASLDKSSASIDLPASAKPSPGGAAPERRPFKTAPTAASRSTRAVKAAASELQAQLNLVQEELRTAREHLASVDSDRARLLEDLAAARRLADDAGGKLEASLLAQRSAEEAAELERFKLTEREQSAVETAHEWRRKYDSIEKRHAEDVASLIAAARELGGVRDELAAAAQARDAAVNQADELRRLADGSAEKVEVLMAEVARLKSQLASKAREAAETVEKMESEASALRAEIQRAMAFETKLAEAEAAAERLRVDVAYAKRGEADANRSEEEWKNTAAALEARLGEVSQLNKRNEESLASLTKSFEDKQSQVLQLEGQVSSLEKEASEYKEKFVEASRRLDAATDEARELRAPIDRLRSEHELLQEAHRQAVGAGKTASARLGHLTEEKNRLVKEVGDVRGERDKAKKAVEDIAAALREVSSEAREAKERVLAKQAELDDAHRQMSELISVRLEMDRLTGSLRSAEHEVNQLRADKAQLLNKLQEESQVLQAMNTSSSGAEEAMAESSHLQHLLSFKDRELLALNQELTELRLRERSASEKASEVSKLLAEVTARKAEEESADRSKALLAKLETDKVLESLKAAEAEARAANGENVRLQSKLRQMESKITEASLTSEEAKISSLRLKETLQEKEHELASLAMENSEARAREAAAQARIDELAALLAEATAAARKGGGGELLLNGGVVARSPEKQPSVLMKLICSPMHHSVVRDDDDQNNGEIVQTEDIKHVEIETVRQVKREEEMEISAVDAKYLELENSKIIEDDLSNDKEGEDDSEPSDDEDDDVEVTGDHDARVDQMNGLLIHGPTSSFNQDQHVHKKKRALLKKFGSLLKKKSHFTKLSSRS